ncbi:MAG: hypothetical protein LQ338_005073 [Usnochroma carphineum]|nr:MAG: hypothetical protein LQ338_005073 [Usnochroma carphineum]
MDKHNMYTQARPNRASPSASQPSVQRAGQRLSEFRPAPSMLARGQHRPITNLSPRDGQVIDVLSLPSSNHSGASGRPNGPNQSMQHGRPGGLSMSNVGSQSGQGGYPSVPRQQCPPIPSSQGVPPSHRPRPPVHSHGLSPSSQSGRLREAGRQSGSIQPSAQSRQPSGVHGGTSTAEKLQDGAPSALSRKPLVDYASDSDDSDDCQVLNSTPAIFETQKAEKESNKSDQRAPTRTGQRQAAAHEELELDDDGYPIESSAPAKPRGTIRYTSHAMKLVKTAQPLRSQDPNKDLRADPNRQKPAVEQAAKRKAPSGDAVDASPAKKSRADNLREYTRMALSQAINAVPPKKTRQPVEHGEIGPPPPGLRPYEDAQRMTAERPRYQPQGRSTVVQNGSASVQAPAGSHYEVAAHAGEKRQQSDDNPRGKAEKRPKTIEHPQAQEPTARNVLAKQTRRFPSVLAKSPVLVGRSELARSPGPKSIPHSKPSDEQQQDAPAIGEFQWNDWVADSSKSIQESQHFVEAGSNSRVSTTPASGQGNLTSFDTSSDAPAVSRLSTQGPSMNSATALDGNQSEATVPAPPQGDMRSEIPQASGAPSANDNQDNELQFGNFDYDSNDLSVLENLADDEDLRLAIERADALFAAHAPTTDANAAEPPAPASSHPVEPSPVGQQPASADRAQAAGGKRGRSELTEDQLYDEYEQEYQAKRQRSDDGEGSSKASASGSKLADSDQKRSLIRRKIEDHKRATAVKKPTAQDYIYAFSSANLDTATFADADIENAYDDPRMDKELRAQEAGAAAAAEDPKPAGSPSLAPAPSTAVETSGGAEQPAEGTAPPSPFADLFFDGDNHYPSLGGPWREVPVSKIFRPSNHGWRKGSECSHANWPDPNLFNGMVKHLQDLSNRETIVNLHNPSNKSSDKPRSKNNNNPRSNSTPNVNYAGATAQPTTSQGGDRMDMSVLTAERKLNTNQCARGVVAYTIAESMADSALTRECFSVCFLSNFSKQFGPAIRLKA